jgi:hypothetical protein
MRLLLPAVGIVVLIATGYALQTLQTHFSSKQVAAAEATTGVPVYELHANKRDMKTLQKQEAPLP